MAADEPLIEPLTPRERDVLAQAAEGRTNDEIAEALSLSVRTVERHLSNIYLKLGVTRASRARRGGRAVRARTADPAGYVSTAIAAVRPADGYASARFRIAVARR